MPKLVILGSSNAIPDEEHENTHMALVDSGRIVLIDCVNSPIVRFRQAGLDINLLNDLILTHFHPDHVSGVPSLLMDTWLLGRTKLLNIYGLAHTLDRVEAMMDAYDWESWPNFFPVKFHRLPDKGLSPVFIDEDYRISAAPVQHLIPTIGLRVESLQTKRVMAYSCDTEPCEAVVRLADGADFLIHEATGATKGHSSAAQAADIAMRAGAKALYLIHYRAGDNHPQSLVDEARQVFNGPVYLAKDFLEVDL